MPFIKWMESYSVHDDKIDDQHKKWIELFNRAHARMIGIEPKDENLGIGEAALTEMIEYTKYHFSSEEMYMRTIGFPMYEEHKNIHQAFAVKLERLFLQMQKGTYVLNSEIIKVSENWFIDHILTEDQKVTKYARRVKEGLVE